MVKLPHKVWPGAVGIQVDGFVSSGAGNSVIFRSLHPPDFCSNSSDTVACVRSGCILKFYRGLVHK